MAGAALNLQPAPMSVAQFLAWAEGQDGVYELLDGVLRRLDAAWGKDLVGFRRHQVIVANLLHELTTEILRRDPPRLALPTYPLAILSLPRERPRVRIPDVAVLEVGDDDRPVLLVEVTSSSDEHEDFSQKRREYARFPSLVEFLEIEQTTPFVTVWRRSPQGLLLAPEVSDRLDGRVRVESLDLELQLGVIYRGLVFPTDA